MIAVAAENLPSATAYRPGDIVRAMNGKTIEVISTDAEGRLVLADALSYAVAQGATAIVDLATLTGGVGVALGTGGAGHHGQRRGLIAAAAGGRRPGRRAAVAAAHLGRLPVGAGAQRVRRHQELRRHATPPRPSAGCSSPCSWGRSPWAHLDIAAVAWVDRDKPGLPKSYIPRGPPAFGTRLLLEFILTRSES